MKRPTIETELSAAYAAFNGHCGDDFEISDFDFAICGCDIRSGNGDRFL